MKLVGKRVRARLYFEPRDIWVGLFWDVRDGQLNIWLCVVPLFPLQLVFPRPK